MRLAAMTLKNFKGIGEPGCRIEFAPITLLFGPNNAGKSTIIQALHLAKEVLCNPYAELDKMNEKGTSLNLGTFKDYVHKHELDREITIEVEYNTLQSKCRQTEKNESGGVKLAIYCDPEDGKPKLKRLSLKRNGYWLTTIHLEYAKDHVTAKIEPLALPFQEACSTSSSELDEINKRVEHIWALKGKNIDYCDNLYDLGMFIKENHAELEEKIYINKFSIFAEILESEDLAGEIVEKPEPLPFIIYSQSPATWIKNMDTIILDNRHEIVSNEIFEDWNRADQLELIVSEFADLVKSPLVNTEKLLKNIKYIGPLRAIPARDMQYVKKNVISDWSGGLAAWHTIAFMSDTEYAKFNNFLDGSKFLDTHYQVSRKRYMSLDSDSELAKGLNQMVADFKDGNCLFCNPGLDAKLYPQLENFLQQDSSVSLKLLNVKNNVEVDPHDMGTGISQVIPCLVSAAIAKDGETVAMEQPELHIHPAWQTDLADVFITSVSGKENPPLFLIETHSEHFLLRLLRRMRKTCKNEEAEDLRLTPKDLAVYWVGMFDKRTEIYPLDLDEDGTFNTPWPEGFFAERGKELFG